MANKTGKGGFKDNPQNKNKKGRPRKENSLAQILDDGLSRKVKAGVRNRVIVNRLFDLAQSKDSDLALKAIGMIFNYSFRNFEFNKKMEIENRITEIEKRLELI